MSTKVLTKPPQLSVVMKAASVSMPVENSEAVKYEHVKRTVEKLAQQQTASRAETEITQQRLVDNQQTIQRLEQENKKLASEKFKLSSRLREEFNRWSQMDFAFKALHMSFETLKKSSQLLEKKLSDEERNKKHLEEKLEKAMNLKKVTTAQAKELALYTKDLEEASRSKKEVEEQLSLVKFQLQKVELDLQEVLKQRDDLNGQLNACKEVMCSEKAHAAETISDLAKQLRLHEQELAREREVAKSAAESIAAVKREFDGIAQRLREKISQQEFVIAKVEEEKLSIEGRFLDVARKSDENASLLSEANGRLETAICEKSGIIAQNILLQKEIDELKFSNAALQDELRTSKESFERLKNEHIRSLEDRGDLDARVKETEDRCQKAESAFRSTISALEDKANELQFINDRQNSDLLQKTLELEKATTELAYLAELNRKDSDSCHSLGSELSKAKNELTSAIYEAQALKSKLQETQLKVEELLKDREKFVKDASKMKAEFQVQKQCTEEIALKLASATEDLLKLQQELECSKNEVLESRRHSERQKSDLERMEKRLKDEEEREMHYVKTLEKREMELKDVDKKYAGRMQELRDQLDKNHASKMAAATREAKEGMTQAAAEWKNFQAQMEREKEKKVSEMSAECEKRIEAHSKEMKAKIGAKDNELAKLQACLHATSLALEQEIHSLKEHETKIVSQNATLLNQIKILKKDLETCVTAEKLRSILAEKDAEMQSILRSQQIPTSASASVLPGPLKSASHTLGKHVEAKTLGDVFLAESPLPGLTMPEITTIPTTRTISVTKPAHKQRCYSVRKEAERLAGLSAEADDIEEPRTAKRRDVREAFGTVVASFSENPSRRITQAVDNSEARECIPPNSDVGEHKHPYSKVADEVARTFEGKSDEMQENKPPVTKVTSKKNPRNRGERQTSNLAKADKKVKSAKKAPCDDLFDDCW